MKRYARMGRFWAPGMVLLLATMAVINWRWNHTAAGSPPPQPADTPSVGVVCFGHVDLEHGVSSLYPLVPGRVTKIAVQENQTVQAGTVLLQLDDRQASYQVQQAEAGLSAAKEQLREAQKLPQEHQAKLAQLQSAVEAAVHRLTAARTALAQKSELEQKKLLSHFVREAAEAQVEGIAAEAKAQRDRLAELELVDPATAIKQAEDAVAAKQAQLNLAHWTQQECAVRAPTDGTVLRTLVSPGDVLGPAPKQPAILFAPNGPRIIRAEVEQEFAGTVKVGQRAFVQDDTTSGTVWPGKVTRIAEWYTPGRSVLEGPLPKLQDVRTLECIVTLDAKQPTLRIGQRVRVTIESPAGQPS